MSLKKLAFGVLGLALIATIPLSANARPGDGENRWMKIDNQTDDVVLEMHVSNTSDGDWGPDQLGSDGTIQPHRYMNWNIDDGSHHCHFDFKFVMANGPDKIARDVNVCTQNEVDVQ